MAALEDHELDEVEYRVRTVHVRHIALVKDQRWWAECLGHGCTWKTRGNGGLEPAFKAHEDHVAAILVAAIEEAEKS